MMVREKDGIALAFAALAAAAAFVHEPRLPIAEAAAFGLTAVSCLPAWRTWRLTPGPGICLTLAALWFSLHAGNAHYPAGLKELCQIGGVLWLAVWAFQSLRGEAAIQTLYRALALGWWASLAAAWWQYMRGDTPAEVSGFLGSRALFATAMACTLPAALSASAEVALLLPAFAILAVALVALYLPGFLLVLVAAIAWAFCCGRGQQRQWALAATALSFLLTASGLTPRPNRILLAESIAAKDSEGMARRWVVEMMAAQEAVKDRPLLGAGPGQYQKTVSSATYRRFTPPTAEDRIEPDTQCVWLVLAVEYGLPGALLLLLAMAGGGISLMKQARNNMPCLWPAAISLALLPLAMAAANLLVQGPAIMIAAFLGLAGVARLTQPEATPQIWQRAYAQAAAICGAIGLAFLSEALLPAPTQPATMAAPQGWAVAMEAEDGVAAGHVFIRTTDQRAAQSACLMACDTPKPVLLRDAGVSYEVVIAKSGAFRPWFRCRWRDGCGNSFAIALDGSDPMLIGNDGTYGVWHWVEGPIWSLAAGKHSLQLLPRESGAAVDQIVLLEDKAVAPRGIWGSENADAVVRSSEAKDLLLWRLDLPPVAERFLIGMGGGHPPGPESYLVRLGLPYVRLRPEEYKSAEALKRLALVWLAGYFEPDIGEIWKALHAYVSSGGTAILEHLWGYTPECRELLAPATLSTNRYGYGMSLEAADSPFFKGVLDRCNLDFHVCRFFGDVTGDGIEAHGRLLAFGQPAGPALMKKRFGKGLLYVLAVPMAFHSMKSERRPEAFETALDRILRDAVADRYEPLFDELAWDAPPPGETIFADDFMRSDGEGQAWRTERGVFHLTGDNQTPLAFALKAEGEAWAATGRSEWHDYRLCASLLSESSEAGIWVTNKRGQRLALAWDEEHKNLSLYARDNGDAKLALWRRLTIPGPAGWRRLSLLYRREAWEAWLDGKLAFRIFCGQDGACGPCGLFNLRGCTYFDDVAVRDTAALLPDSDVCLGEEGSPRADPVFSFGIEPRMLYAPTWYLRPDPARRHVVRLALPAYRPSLFRFDGADMGWIEPDSEGPLIALPQGKKPQREIAVACLGWRDYIFQAQPASWYDTGSRWHRQPRWACDRRWSFMGTETQRESILWYRHALQPPYAFCVYVAIAGGGGARQHQGRDLNLILGGNGLDLTKGVRILVNPAGRRGCELWQGEERLFINHDIGLPHGYLLHHHWYCLKAIVEEERLRFYYEDALVFDAKPRRPILRGQVGFWTKSGQVSIGRATISAAE